MNPPNDLLTVLLTSAVVAAIVSFILKILFEMRFQHHLDGQLEELKADLNMRTNTAHEIMERRLSVYPKLVELVYRTRNMAREISSTKAASPVLADELMGRAHELEESLYSGRMDLERDNIFVPIHSYKNAVKTFSRLVEDYKYHQNREEVDSADEVFIRLCELYTEIESQHKPIIQTLSGHTPSPAT